MLRLIESEYPVRSDIVEIIYSWASVKTMLREVESM